MADFSYVLWDTALFGTTAGVESSLFQVAQGGDSTHTKSFTNSRGSGQLPTNENFEIMRVGISVDENLAVADYINVWIDSYLEIRVNDETVFQCPLRLLAEYNAFGGHFTQASAGDEGVIGLAGMGYELKIPIVIPGGTAFRVLVYQGTALAGSNVAVRAALHGTLIRQ